jgi:hypothetical protein
LEGDLAILQGPQTVVGDGHAMGVAAEVLQHVARSAKGGLSASVVSSCKLSLTRMPRENFSSSVTCCRYATQSLLPATWNPFDTRNGWSTTGRRKFLLPVKVLSARSRGDHELSTRSGTGP